MYYAAFSTSGRTFRHPENRNLSPNTYRLSYRTSSIVIKGKCGLGAGTYSVQAQLIQESYVGRKYSVLVE